VYDPYVTEITRAQKVETVADVVAERDIVFIAVPLVKDTKNLINQSLLEKTAPDTIWVNTSRGGIVDEQTMYNFLSKNNDAGYYADVRENEPVLTDNIQKLLTLPNCLITPHIGAVTHGAQAQMHYFPLLIDVTS
jgi:D-3-phosphoglycerate dehydrogenase